MNRKLLNLLAVPALGLALTACDVEKTDDGNLELPSVDVHGGDVDAPEYDVQGPDVDVRGGSMPEVDVKGGSMPSVDVDLPKDHDADGDHDEPVAPGADM